MSIFTAAVMTWHSMELVGVINIIKGAALHLAVLISGPCSVAGFTDALQCNTAIIKELIAHVLFLPSQDKMSALKRLITSLYLLILFWKCILLIYELFVACSRLRTLEIVSLKPSGTLSLLAVLRPVPLFRLCVHLTPFWGDMLSVQHLTRVYWSTHRWLFNSSIVLHSCVCVSVSAFVCWLASVWTSLFRVVRVCGVRGCDLFLFS